MAEPKLEKDDLPQLNLVAVESGREALQAGEKARTVHKAPIHYLHLVLLPQEIVSQRTQRFEPGSVEKTL
jgi:hypothetical protein